MELGRVPGWGDSHLDGGVGHVSLAKMTWWVLIRWGQSLTRLPSQLAAVGWGSAGFGSAVRAGWWDPVVPRESVWGTKGRRYNSSTQVVVDGSSGRSGVLLFFLWRLKSGSLICRIGAYLDIYRCSPHKLSCTCPSFCFQPHAFGLFAGGGWFFECGGAPDTGHQVHTRLKNGRIDGRTSRLELIELYDFFPNVAFRVKHIKTPKEGQRYAQIPGAEQSRGARVVQCHHRVPCRVVAAPCRSVSKCPKYQKYS